MIKLIVRRSNLSSKVWHQKPYNKLLLTSKQMIEFQKPEVQTPVCDGSSPEYIRYMHNTRSIINNNAVQNQYKYDQVRARSYNKKRVNSHQYETGDLILIDISRRTHGNLSKLNPTWHGPHKIIRIYLQIKFFNFEKLEI